MIMFKTIGALMLLLLLGGCSSVYTTTTKDGIFFSGLVPRGASLTYYKNNENIIITFNEKTKIYNVKSGGSVSIVRKEGTSTKESK